MSESEHRKGALGAFGWLIVGTLIGLGIVGFFTGIILVIPAVLIGMSLSRRGWAGRWFIAPGFGAGGALLLLDDVVGPDKRCAGTSSCAGITHSLDGVFWFFVAIAVLGTVVALVFYSRTHPDDLSF